MKEKKKFIVPEAEIIQFSNEDIIVTSLANKGDYGDQTGTDEDEGW